RNTDRLVGRPAGHTSGTVPDRVVVVLPHRGNGSCLQLSGSPRDPVSVWDGGSGRVAVRCQDILSMDPDARAGTSAGSLLCRRAFRRWADASSGALASDLH